MIDVTQQQYRSFYLSYFFLILDLVITITAVLIFLATQIVYVMVVPVFAGMIITINYVMSLVLGDKESVVIQYRLGFSNLSFEIREIIHCQVTYLPWYKLVETQQISGFSSPDISGSGNSVEVHLSSGKVIRFKTRDPQGFIDYIQRVKRGEYIGS